MSRMSSALIAALSITCLRWIQSSLALANCTIAALSTYVQDDDDVAAACADDLDSCTSIFADYYQAVDNDLRVRAKPRTRMNSRGTPKLTLAFDVENDYERDVEEDLFRWLLDCMDAAVDFTTEEDMHEYLIRTLECLAFPTSPPYEDAIQTWMSVRIMKNLSIDPESGTLTLAIWMRLFWLDERIFYRGDEYFDQWDSYSDSLSMKTGPGGSIWYPDVLLTNGVFSNYDEIANFNMRAQLYDEQFAEAYGWNVRWSRMMKISSRCAVNYKLFPFDTQLCPLVFSPWTYDRRIQLNLQSSGYSSLYQPGISLTAESFELIFDDISVFYNLGVTTQVTAGGAEVDKDFVATSIIYFLRLRRLPHYFIIHLFWSIITIVIFSYLTFWLPFRVYARISLTVMVLLTVFSIMAVLYKNRPPYAIQTWLDDFISGSTILCMLPAFQTILLVRAGEIIVWKKESQWQQVTLDPIESAIVWVGHKGQRIPVIGNEDALLVPLPSLPSESKSFLDGRSSNFSEWPHDEESMDRRRTGTATGLTDNSVPHMTGDVRRMNTVEGNRREQTRPIYTWENRNGEMRLRRDLSEDSLILTRFVEIQEVFNRILANTASQTQWTDRVDNICAVIFPGFVCGFLLERIRMLTYEDDQAIKELFVGTGGEDISATLSFSVPILLMLVFLWLFAYLKFFVELFGTDKHPSEVINVNHNLPDAAWVENVYARAQLTEANLIKGQPKAIDLN